MKEREEKKQQRDPAAFFTDMMSWGANIRQPLAAHLWYIFNYLQLLLAYPLLRPLYPDRTEKTVGGASALPQRRLCGVQRMQMQPIPIVGTVFI